MDLITYFKAFVIAIDVVVALLLIVWFVTGGWHRKKPFSLQEFRASLSHDERVNDEYLRHK